MSAVKFQTRAWLTTYDMTTSPSGLRQDDGVQRVTLSQSDMAGIGWTLVGEAECTVELISNDEIVENKVEALKAEAANIRAEATAKCTRIEGQIQQLLCLENGVEA